MSLVKIEDENIHKLLVNGRSSLIYYYIIVMMKKKK